MQKNRVLVSIFGVMALVLIAIAFVFGFGRAFNGVRAENNLGEMKVKIITVDNESNGYISERPVNNLTSVDTPITLSSYTELVGARIDGGNLYLKNSDTPIVPSTTYTNTTCYELKDGETLYGIAHYSETLKKVIWFQTKQLELKLYDISGQDFKFELNGTVFSETATEALQNGNLQVNIKDGDNYVFGSALSGTFTFDTNSEGIATTTGTWVSDKMFETHEALLIEIRDKTGQTRYDIYSQNMLLNDEEIDGYGRFQNGTLGTYYSKEYHGIPATIIDECKINSAAKTRKVYATNEFLNVLEGHYALSVSYRVNTGATQTSNFEFYLITSNTYANTDEILNFYNTNTPSTISPESPYSKLHYFNHNNLESTNLLDIKSPVVITEAVTQTTSGLEIGGKTYKSLVDDKIYDAMIGGDGDEDNFNGQKGIIYKDTLTEKWMFADRLLYPTITFNPEKYDLKFQKTWYNNTQNGEFVFETQNDLYGKMQVVYKNSNGQTVKTDEFLVSRKTDEIQGVVTNIRTNNDSNKTLISFDLGGTTQNASNGIVNIDGINYYYNKVEDKICEYSLDAPFIAKYAFEELGEYEFFQRYKLKISDNNYFVTDSINADIDISAKNEKMFISGYQATYRQNGETQSYLRNENYVSDFSYLLNSARCSKDASLTLPGSVQKEEVSVDDKTFYRIILNNNEAQALWIDNSKITTTNQPPVSLKYLATPNDRTGKSWFIYFDNNNGNSVEAYNNSKSFEASGLYVVFLSFVDNKDTTYSYNQLIAFKITSSQPEVSIQTTTSDNITGLSAKGAKEDALKSNSFTNKNVFIQWLNNDVFNATIRATYSRYDFNGTKLESNVSLNGLIYFSKSSEIINNNTTLFTQNGRYVVSIYYTKNDSTTRSFVIDKTNISGIKALQIASDGTIFQNPQNKTLSAATLSTESNFNLVVNSPFVWTWNEKESGASIEAKYYYSNISSKSSYILDSILNGGETWVLANGEFGEVLTGTTYEHTIVSSMENNENYWTNVKFNNSQIISTNCLAILVLKDSAGNSASFATIYDTIAPQTIQLKAQSSEKTTSTLISTTTQFVWGSHKALSVFKTDSANLQVGNVFTDILNPSLNSTTISFGTQDTYNISPTIYSAIKEVFKSKNSDIYYTLPIKRVKAQYVEASIEANMVPQKVGSDYINTSIFVVIKEQGEGFVTYLSSSANGSSISGSPISLSEHPSVQFTLTNVDKMENSSSLNKNISLDQSDGRMFAYTTLTSGITNNSIIDETKLTDTEKMKVANRQQMFNSYSTNRQFLTFSFLQQTYGNFIVGSIELDFYALNKNLKTIDDGENIVANPNYPYNTTALHYYLYSEDSSQSIMKNLSWEVVTETESDTYSGTYYQSSAINLSSNGLTAPGKYVFTRTYKTDIDELNTDENKGDTTRFTYTVYVDREGVITDDLKVLIGVENYNNQNNYTTSETQKVFTAFDKNQRNAAQEFLNIFHFNSTVPSFTQARATLNTDMLPAKIGLKVVDGITLPYKYYFVDENGALHFLDQVNSNLLVLVQYFEPENPKNLSQNVLKTQTLYSANVTQTRTIKDKYFSAPLNSLSSQSFSNAGIYQVFIMDLSNINMPLDDSQFANGWSSILNLWDKDIYGENFTPNVASFSFILRKEEIVASAIIKNSNMDTYTTLNISKIGENEYYYTNNNNVIFTFSDSIDEYKAKVAYKDWKLTRTVKTVVNGQTRETVEPTISPSNTLIRTYDPNNETANMEIFSENEINRIKGLTQSTVSTMTFSTKENDGGILYYRTKFGGIEDDRYTYYILLPSNINEGTTTDCSYNLILNYLGNKNDYVTASGISYYEKTIRAYIDNTAPYQNVLKLIQNDTYLNSEQRQDMISNLNNPDHEFMKYYAFGVGTSFSLTSIDDSENIDYYYYKNVTQKYDGTQNPNQVAIPESKNYNIYTNNRFSENLNKIYYIPSSGERIDGRAYSITESGYYDIIEVDKAGNHRVYTIYINGTNGGVKLDASAQDSNENDFAYSFVTSFKDGIPTYEVTLTQNGSDTKIYSKQELIDYSNIQNIPNISVANFNINSIIIQDEWYVLRYRLLNGANSSTWQTITMAPQVYSTISGIQYNTKEQNISLLNEFINSNIESGKFLDGSRLELEIINRGGNNLRFIILSPGQSLTISNLSPTLVVNRYFMITIPADTYSTKFSDFRITQNGITLSTDHNTPAKTIASLKTNRNSPQDLRFLLGNYRYSIFFKDNFGRSYEFIYPTTEGIVNELLFEEGANPNFDDNGILTSPTSATFNYTTGVRDRISVEIVDLDTSETLVMFENMPYVSADENDLVHKLSDENIKTYVDYTYNSSTSVVSLNFVAIKNRHIRYNIKLLDIDNNITERAFAIYTHAPTITLTDTVGIEIFNNTSSNKVTSKTVVVRYPSTQTYKFNEKIKIFDGTTTRELVSSEQIKNAGEYKIFIDSNIGIMNVFTIDFTIKPATTDIYSVYYADTLLSAHTVKYNFEKDGTSKLIDSFFFLSSENNAFTDIRILPSEDKELTTELIATSGNTRIYKIFGNVYEDYFAVTQIYPVSNNHLTYFSLQTTTDGETFVDANIGSGVSQYNAIPTSNKKTFVKVHWITSEAGFANFVYAEVWYNDKSVYMGKFTEDFVLTKSGNYSIQIFDIVGQQHRFGLQNKAEFTLNILNDVNYMMEIDGQKQNPIENQTFNTSVTLTLENTDRYDWKNGGFITVLKNNKAFTNYVKNDTSWTFSEAGYYSIYVETPLKSNTTTPIKISATAHFTILDENESKTVYDFAKISGYSVSRIERIDYNSDLAELISYIKSNYAQIDEDSSQRDQVISSFAGYNKKLLDDNNITTVTELANLLNTIDENSLLYSYVDVTNTLKKLLETDTLQSFKITPENLGIGKYQITVNVEASELVASQTYTYKVWINNEEPTITPSRSFGSSSVKSFSISYNPSIIFNQVGNSYIMINDILVDTISEQSSSQNQVKTYRVSSPGTYLIQVYSKSGSLISSQRITIDVPLNTAAIILIIVAVVVVVGVVVIFIIFRTKMKVK